jgi:hypothetical protein
VIQEFDTSEAMERAAYSLASRTSGIVLPGVLFVEGDRLFCLTALTYEHLRRYVKYRPAPKGSSEAHGYLNRPLHGPHALEIKSYVLHNPQKYILPPLTINMPKQPSILALRTDMTVPIRAVLLVLPPATVMEMADGLHRGAGTMGFEEENGVAVRGAIDEMPSLALNAQPLMLTFESDVNQAHQDFADCARSMPIPGSLLAAFDQRSVANKMTITLASQAHILRGRVDETSKTLSKASQSICVLSVLRSFVKSLALGDYGIGDPYFVQEASKRWKEQPAFDAWRDEALEMLDVLADTMEPWCWIKDLEPGKSESNKIPAWRAEYLNLTPSGFYVLGQVGSTIQSASRDRQWRREMYARLGTEIDWRRTADIWQKAQLVSAIQDEKGNPKVGEDGKLVTNIARGRAAISNATRLVKTAIGLPISTEAPKKAPAKKAPAA